MPASWWLHSSLQCWNNGNVAISNKHMFGKRLHQDFQPINYLLSIPMSHPQVGLSFFLVTPFLPLLFCPNFHLFHVTCSVPATARRGPKFCLEASTPQFIFLIHTSMQETYWKCFYTKWSHSQQIHSLPYTQAPHAEYWTVSMHWLSETHLGNIHTNSHAACEL